MKNRDKIEGEVGVGLEVKRGGSSKKVKEEKRTTEFSILTVKRNHSRTGVEETERPSSLRLSILIAAVVTALGLAALLLSRDDRRPSTPPVKSGGSNKEIRDAKTSKREPAPLGKGGRPTVYLEERPVSEGVGDRPQQALVAADPDEETPKSLPKWKAQDGANRGSPKDLPDAAVPKPAQPADPPPPREPSIIQKTVQRIQDCLDQCGDEECERACRAPRYPGQSAFEQDDDDVPVRVNDGDEPAMRSIDPGGGSPWD